MDGKNVKERLLNHLFPPNEPPRVVNFGITAFDPSITEEELCKELLAGFEDPDVVIKRRFNG
ncbi:MAG: hypothetical protein HYS73_00305 [Parcubacteria group bacterium]|nr:hypothetical protein [Parcubacteria group bacterium]MBI2049150.1 hypothetical protein [Parcubacteria group bacterium]